MRLYNFIYCYFYEIWQKKDDDGRFEGTMHVLITIIIHVLLIYRILYLSFGVKLFILPDTGKYGANKTLYMIMLIPLSILLYRYFNVVRTKKMLNVYRNKFYKKKGIKILNLFLILIIPLLILLFLLFKDL